MKTTFTNEDNRKDQLFKAWGVHLESINEHLGHSRFDQIYEGPVTVLGFSNNVIGLELEDGRKLRSVPIDDQISQYSRKKDLMYMALGFTRGKWWPLDLVSVASLPNGENGSDKTDIHFSIAPHLAGTLSGERLQNKPVIQ